MNPTHPITARPTPLANPCGFNQPDAGHNIDHKQRIQKYLVFRYWTSYLKNQGLLTDQEYRKMLYKTRRYCGIF